MRDGQRDFFSLYHPAVTFVCFAAAAVFPAVLRHPAARLMSLTGAFVCSACSAGLKKTLHAMRLFLPAALIFSLMNPVFNHSGTMVLAYLPSGNPLTLESLAYGASSGVALAAALLWFLSFNRVMTAEKLIFLFGKTAPSAALVLSMALRFIPDFRRTLTELYEARMGLMEKPAEEKIRPRLKNASTVLSAMLGITAENAAETARSMKSRGYGLSGRTSFSVYKMKTKDCLALAAAVFCIVLSLSGAAAGAFDFEFFPTFSYPRPNAVISGFYSVYAVFCLLPAAINALEEKRWRASYSAM